jgi:hypothetical protein
MTVDQNPNAATGMNTDSENLPLGQGDSADLDHPHDSEVAVAGNGHSEPKRRGVQFSLAALLIVQAVVSLALGIWKGFSGAILVAIVTVGTMLVLVLAGTVAIASDLSLARAASKYIVRSLIIGSGVVWLVALLLAILDAVAITW